MFSPSLINVAAIFERITNILFSVFYYFTSKDFFDLLNFIWWLFLAFSALFLSGILYFINKLLVIRVERDQKIFGPKGGSLKDIKAPAKNERWEKIKQKIDSENPSDWNLAIIEADKILDEMLISMGHQGENLGERLKAVEPSDFLTLNEAWEAHKVRNQIAHEDSFVLTQREAKAALGHYEKVFEEFDYI